jgi:hypothetical protein
MTHGGSLAATRRPSYAQMSTRAMGRRLARRDPKRRPWTDHVEVHMALAHGVALPATAGDWMTYGMMSMGSIHGPRCTCLTWFQVLNQSEEGRRRRGRAHRRGRWHQSSMAVKVPILWVRERLWALVNLWDLCTQRERWLSTDKVAENRGKRGSDGLPGADTAMVRTRCSGWPPFITVDCIEAMCSAPGERK